MNKRNLKKNTSLIGLKMDNGKGVEEKNPYFEYY